MIDQSFWSGKRVFLTGHTGFKGAWLALWLARMGADVTGYSLAPATTPNLFNSANIDADMTQSIIGDVRDEKHLLQAIKDAAPDICFHLAAQSLVRESYDEPAATFGTNLMGTVNLLEAARQIDTLQCVIIITTDKVYENNEWSWPYRENDPLGGADPYSASKACAEIATHAYRKSFFQSGHSTMQIASARAGNVIGGGDWSADRLVPDCIRAFSAGEPVSLRNPASVRPWQHVLEPLAGYLLLAQRLCSQDGAQFAQSWNFGPDARGEANVGQVAQGIANAWGEGAKVTLGKADNSRKESGILRLDSTNARVQLGWQPVFSFADTLDETTRWYKQFGHGAQAKALTMSQIENYQKALTLPESVN